MIGTNILEGLEGSISGRVLSQPDPDYDRARRVFYPFYDRRPAVIVQPANDQDVVTAVTLAADTGLELAVKSGGHSPGGHATTDGGILLDMSRMKGLQIDLAERTAWAETGLTAGEYTVQAGAHGLATGFGDTGSVGIGGLTLSGGIGYLVRKHGLTIDNLLAADMVVADGSEIRVAQDNHPDLFWAIRGGGGNFGVATRFQFRLHEVSTIFGGMSFIPATADVITDLIAAAEAAPDELSIIANIMNLPPMPGMPEEHIGQPAVMLLMAYTGQIKNGEKATAPIRNLAKPIMDMVGPMRYPDMFQFTAEVPEIKHEIGRSLFVDEVDHGSAEAILEHLGRTTAPIAVAQLRVLGGAMARVPDDATAFAHRRRPVMAAVGVVYDDASEDDIHREWAEGLATSLRNGEPGVYVGFLGEEGESRVREAYEGTTWDRLRAVKAKYDPTNLFRRNQNILPAS